MTAICNHCRIPKFTNTVIQANIYTELSLIFHQYLEEINGFVLFIGMVPVLLKGSPDIPKQTVISLQQVLGLFQGLYPVVHSWFRSTGSRTGSILIRWPNHQTNFSKFRTVSLLFSRIVRLLMMIMPNNPAQEPHFHHLYLWPYYFRHYLQLVTIGIYMTGKQKALSTNWASASPKQANIATVTLLPLTWSIYLKLSFPINHE